MTDQRAIEIADITGIMKTEGGRAFLARHLRTMGYVTDIFDKDPIQHAYNAGRRSAALSIVNDIKSAAPGEFQLLLKENFYG